MSQGESMDPARVRASYQMETALAPELVAAGIAGEQSSGTFIALPQEDQTLKDRAAARVETLTEIAVLEGPSLPGSEGSRGGGPFRRYAMTLSWPLANFGASLPNLVATVAGNLFELKQVAGLKLLDVELPEAFAGAYPGPAFGVEGTRRLTGVQARPLIGTIIKPSVGLSPDETAAVVEQLCAGGIDFIKDDELQADGPACPFEARLRAVMKVIDRHADRSGQRVMYAFNITGELDEMRRRHDLVEQLGGTSVMVSLNSVGLVGFSALRRTTRLAIHAHRNGWGYLGRCASNGWSYVAWQKLWRLAGADHMHVNGIANKFGEPDDSVIASARACLTPMFESKPCVVMPVLASAQSAKQALGDALGEIALGLTQRHTLQRLVFAGGDTSGRIVTHLPIDALEAVSPLALGSPICRAHSSDARFDGMELVLKGGQVGDRDFFVSAKARTTGSAGRSGATA